MTGKTYVLPQRGQHPPHLPGLALESGGQQQGAKAQSFRLVPGGQEGHTVIAHHDILDPGEDGVTGLGGFRMEAGSAVLEVLPHRGRQTGSQPVPVHDGETIGEAAVIGHRGAGGDDVEAVSHHIREDQGDQGGRISRPGQPAAFAPGEMLADAVDLADFGPAFQEQLGGQLFLGEVKGGAGAGNKALAPPEKAQTTRSCSEAAPSRRIISAVPSRPAWSGMG